MSEDDRAAVRQFLATRDEDAFRRLYRTHTPRMLMLALRLCGGVHQNAEDVVQEAWSRACQSLAGFRGDSALSTWLCGIVVNCFREQRRSAFGMMDDVAEPMVPPPSDGSLEQLVQQLPARCREVLVLHDIEGYKHEEIARMLQIAEGTSKHYLFRARQLLTDWLTPTEIRSEVKKSEGNSE